MFALDTIGSGAEVPMQGALAGEGLGASGACAGSAPKGAQLGYNFSVQIGRAHV